MHPPSAVGSSSASKCQGQKTDPKGNLDKNHFILSLSLCLSANLVSRLRAVFDSVQTPHCKLRGKQSQMCMESKVAFSRRFLGAKQDWGIVYETSLCDFLHFFKKSSPSRSNVTRNASAQDCYNVNRVRLSFLEKKKSKKISICIRKYFLACFICYGSHEQIFWRLKTGGEITQVPYLMVF